MDLANVEVRPIQSAHIAPIVSDPFFAASFGSRPYRFAWVRPERLIALQAFVKPRGDPQPQSEDELLRFALPQGHDVPAEITFIPPAGPIYIVSSSPNIQGLRIQLDGPNNRVIIEPPPHLNLVQVANFEGSYYLRNGYHRVYDLMHAGASEVPAVVVTPGDANEVAIPPGQGSFNFNYIRTLPRPPVLADFDSAAAVDMKVRERRHGVSISLQLAPLSVGL